MEAFCYNIVRNSVRPAIFGKQSMQNQSYELFFILSPRRPFLKLLRESKNEMQVGLRFKK